MLTNLPCQRVGTYLELEDLARRALASLHVEGCTCADGGPQPPTLPARIGVINTAVEPFGVKAHRVRNAKYDPLTVLQGKKPFRFVACVDRCVFAESGRVELIHPSVIA